MRLGLGFGTRRGGACLGAFATAPATEYTVYVEKAIAGTASRDEALVLAWDAAGVDSIDVVTPVGGVWSTTITARECDYGNTTVYLIRLSTGQVLAMLAVSVVAPATLSSFLATADDTIDVQSGDAHSWVSAWGGVTWHRPAYYAKTGNAPAFNAAAFSGGRAGVVFDAANTEALIADSGSGFTNGVGDSLSWTVASQVLVTTDGCVISTGRQASTTPYTSHRTDLHMSLRDDASANGTVSAASAVEGSEHVIVWTQQGVTKRFWVDGVPLGGNPYTGASQGQRTIDQMAMGALFIGNNSWSTYLTGAVRRVGAGPVYCTDAQAVALSAYWLGS